MFHNTPPQIQNRVATLDAVDTRDCQDGAPNARRLRQIPPENGNFHALMAAGAPPGLVLEIGTRKNLPARSVLPVRV